MALQDQLKALADAFKIGIETPPGLGTPAAVRITPPGDLNLLDAVGATLKLTWLTKDVVFKTATTEQALTQAPPSLPTIDNLLKGGQTYIAPPGVPALTGVPGMIGQLVGELPTQITTTIPVRFSVKWKVTDLQGRAVTSKAIEESVARGVFALAPDIVDDTGAPQAPAGRRITAEITVSATAPAGAPALSDEKRTLSVDVTVPTLRVPTFLLLMNHVSFDLGTHGGVEPCALVLVPPALPYRDVTSLLAVVNPLAQALTTIAPFFPTLPRVGDVVAEAARLNRLVSLLNVMQSPIPTLHPVVWASDSETDLSRIVFYVVFLWRQTAEDSLGSLIYVGLSGRTARFYNARDFDTSEGAFNLNIPTTALSVVIDSLSGDPPATDPSGAATRHGTRTPGTFNDRISSFQLIP